MFRGYRVAVWVDEKVLKWLEVMITQHCVYTKKPLKIVKVANYVYFAKMKKKK